MAVWQRPGQLPTRFREILRVQGSDDLRFRQRIHVDVKLSNQLRDAVNSTGRFVGSEVDAVFLLVSCHLSP